MTQRCYNGVRLLGNGPSLKNVQKIDGGAMPMILSMQQTGLQVDLAHFARLSIELTRDMERITEEVKALTGHYINIDSGDQVADLLFKKLGLEQARPKFTASGDRESVVDEVLTAIQHEHPVIPKILDYKELSKLKGTYVDPIPRLARKVVAPGCNHYTWRIMPHFKTTRVPSGRLACSDPNLLAMPSRTERGRDIRKGFITDQGWCYVSVDESQIEVRLAAHSSGDAGLMAVYENEEDIYSDFATAAFRLSDQRHRDVAGWHYPTVKKLEHRYPAKTCVLASIYDVSPQGLLEQMPVICATCNLPAQDHTCLQFRTLWNEENCAGLISAFYLKYPGVMSDRKHHHRIARQNGFVWDMWGRILHVAAVRSVLKWVVSAALREVGNFPYQSGAQGTIKLAMAEAWDTLKGGRIIPELVRPVLQVHDELLYECRKDVAEELIYINKHIIENCVRLRVPIKASGVSADSWGALEK